MQGAALDPIDAADVEPRRGLFIRARFDAAWLRETIVDVNDGIIATAGIVEGFLGFGAADFTVALAAVTAMLAGGISGGAAKFNEAASERDAQLAFIEEQKRQLAMSPEEELAELEAHYRKRGLSKDLARAVSVELSEHDPIAAHAEAELGLSLGDPQVLPSFAAANTALAFAIGSSVPLLSAIVAPDAYRIVVTFAAVAFSLCATSVIQSRGSRTRTFRTIVRTVGVGFFVMGITYAAGTLFELS